MDYREKRQREEDRARRQAGKRGRMVTVLVTDAELDRLNARARSLGLSLADYSRSLYNADLRSANLPPLRVGREPAGYEQRHVPMSVFLGTNEQRRPGQPKGKALKLGELVPREPAGAYTPRVPPKPKPTDA
jgi:hypothetical protein